ncbi:high-potential iron-sulfur protein [Lentisalinibacter orientalis]|uniref:high-potential iron-sulfur protein n=1 Tax=Lentisalinibacter orientalis TaxID=2992241 RepID=UPI00386C2479
MSEYSDPAGRRKFLKLVGGTVVLVPLAGLAACSGGGDSAPASGGGAKPSADEGSGSGADMAKDAAGDAGMSQESAQESGQAAADTAESQAGEAAAAGDGRPKLSVDDPQAKALGYVHDATEVDQSKYARYQPGQACSNCQLFQAKGDEEWAGCSLFPGKLVNAAGWCSAYAPKA